MSKPLRIALLAANRNPARFAQDPAFVYRCENLGQALRGLGLEAEWQHFRGWRPRPGLASVVLHRPRASFALWRLCLRLRRLGARLVADFDDLVFDASLARYNPGVRNGLVPLRQIEQLYRDHHAALKWFDHFTVATAALRDALHRQVPGKPITVIHNAVHWDWINRPQPARPPQGARAKLITYLPGTRSHDRDFAQIAEPLARFLRAHPEVRLRVTGPLGCALEARPGQVQRQDKVPFAAFADQVRDGWVNLAPLEDTPFNACKSALKVLEAGYWGIPTLCSPNPDYARFRDAGALLAADPGEWLLQLERLLDDSYYLAVTADLRRRSLALADVKAQAAVFIEQVLQARDGP